MQTSLPSKDPCRGQQQFAPRVAQGTGDDVRSETFEGGPGDRERAPLRYGYRPVVAATGRGAAEVFELSLTTGRAERVAWAGAHSDHGPTTVPCCR